MIDLEKTRLSSETLHTAAGIPILLERFPETDYDAAYKAMKRYSNERDATAADRIWLIEHPPTYTQGTACEQQTLIPSDIPVVKTDRGGQITFHGPGQIVLYPLLHLRSFGLGVKALVYALEQSVIDVLADYQVLGERREDAPGVYVAGEKIAALGLRIRRGNTYHGLSFNIDMDLLPFANIDPCGYQGLRVTQLGKLVDQNMDRAIIGKQLVQRFVSQL